jgi:large repetitive protein
MHKLLGLLAAIATASVLLVLAGGEALAAVQCGDVITQDTTLDSDLIDCSGAALTIGADDITLDLGGHTIGSTNVGIDDTSHREVVIENGTVRGSLGIRLLDAHKTVLRDLDVGGGEAVSLDDSDQNVFRDSTISGYSDGVVIEAGSDFNRLEHSKLSAYRYGPPVLIEGSSYNTIRENQIENTFGGIGLSEADHNTVIGNTVSAEETGIGLGKSDANVVKDNVLHVGIFAKIALEESDQNLILDNDAADNAQATFGIWVWDFSSDNRIKRNDTSGNRTGIGVIIGDRNILTANSANGSVGSNQLEFGGDGIFVSEFGKGTLLSRNQTNRNLDDGIDIRDPTSVLIHNTANFNGDLGIVAVPGVTDGGGNRASGNGNPLQCLNVSCK